MWTTRSEKVHVIIFLGVFCLFKGYTIFHPSSALLEQAVAKEFVDLRISNLNTPRNIKNKTGQEASVLMNDPSIRQNWGTLDVNALRAWEISQGSRDITVAVIDTGIDIQHEDLKNNLWKNPGETGIDKNGKSKATNKIDDDGNGFVDDVHGWNFVTNNNNIKDHHGHGTHVAGIIGAERGNKKGISGISPKVSLMILKYYDPKFSNTDNLKNTIQAIKYATKMGAKIINYSGGGIHYSAREFKAIKQARDKGILFVAASGNESSNSNKSNYYPAKYPLDNIISVTAINSAKKVLSSSNWGNKTVHIAAPGENILSTLPNNNYGRMTGTSQATAFVSGVGALLYAQNKEFDYQAVRNRILSTVEEEQHLRSKTIKSGKLNAWRALAMQPAVPLTGVNDTSGANLLPQFTNAGNTTQTLSSLENNIGKILDSVDHSK